MDGSILIQTPEGAIQWQGCSGLYAYIAPGGVLGAECIASGPGKPSAGETGSMTVEIGGRRWVGCGAVLVAILGDSFDVRLICRAEDRGVLR